MPISPEAMASCGRARSRERLRREHRIQNVELSLDLGTVRVGLVRVVSSLEGFRDGRLALDSVAARVSHLALDNLAVPVSRPVLDSLAVPVSHPVLDSLAARVGHLALGFGSREQAARIDRDVVVRLTPRVRAVRKNLWPVCH